MTNTKKEQIVVLQDDREPECQIMSDLQNWNVTFESKRLICGDYVYKNLIIERKTMDDFCSSILDRRMIYQTEKMKKEMEEGKECFVVVIGNIKDRKIDIHENCVLGKICSLVYKHKIKVIQCDDEFQFLYCLRNLCDKYDYNEMSKMPRKNEK